MRHWKQLFRTLLFQQTSAEVQYSIRKHITFVIVLSISTYAPIEQIFWGEVEINWFQNLYYFLAKNRGMLKVFQIFICLRFPPVAPRVSSQRAVLMIWIFVSGALMIEWSKYCFSHSWNWTRVYTKKSALFQGTVCRRFYATITAWPERDTEIAVESTTEITYICTRFLPRTLKLFSVKAF